MTTQERIPDGGRARDVRRMALLLFAAAAILSIPAATADDRNAAQGSRSQKAVRGFAVSKEVVCWALCDRQLDPVLHSPVEEPGLADRRGIVPGVLVDEAPSIKRLRLLLPPSMQVAGRGRGHKQLMQFTASEKRDMIRRALRVVKAPGVVSRSPNGRRYRSQIDRCRENANTMARDLLGRGLQAHRQDCYALAAMPGQPLPAWAGTRLWRRPGLDWRSTRLRSFLDLRRVDGLGHQDGAALGRARAQNILRVLHVVTQK